MGYQNKLGKQLVKLTPNNNSYFYSNKDKWSSKEDKQLKACVSLFGHRWLKVAQKMGYRNASQCCQRWKRIRQRQGFQCNRAKRWTQKEDETLLRIFKEIGPSWNAIAKQMKIKSGKQVRSRYKNVLDPNLNHEPLTEVEDELIYKEYLKQGSQWSKISEKLPGRSQNMIKNRFYSYLKQKYMNQPYLYFKVKPFDYGADAQRSNFQEVQNISPNSQSYEMYDQDLDIDNSSNLYWSYETREHNFQKKK